MNRRTGVSVLFLFLVFSLLVCIGCGRGGADAARDAEQQAAAELVKQAGEMGVSLPIDTAIGMLKTMDKEARDKKLQEMKKEIELSKPMPPSPQSDSQLQAKKNKPEKGMQPVGIGESMRRFTEEAGKQGANGLKPAKEKAKKEKQKKK